MAFHVPEATGVSQTPKINSKSPRMGGAGPACTLHTVSFGEEEKCGRNRISILVTSIACKETLTALASVSPFVQ